MVSRYYLKKLIWTQGIQVPRFEQVEYKGSIDGGYASIIFDGADQIVDADKIVVDPPEFCVTDRIISTEYIFNTVLSDATVAFKKGKPVPVKLFSHRDDRGVLAQIVSMRVGIASKGNPGVFVILDNPSAIDGLKFRFCEVDQKEGIISVFVTPDNFEALTLEGWHDLYSWAKQQLEPI